MCLFQTVPTSQVIAAIERWPQMSTAASAAPAPPPPIPNQELMSTFPAGSGEDQPSRYVISIVSVTELDFCFTTALMSVREMQEARKRISCLLLVATEGPGACWQKIISSFHTNKIKKLADLLPSCLSGNPLKTAELFWQQH